MGTRCLSVKTAPIESTIPSTIANSVGTMNSMVSSQHYKALKILKKLIAREAFSLSKAESEEHLSQAATRGHQ
jgi:hypothetical protein